VAPTVALLEQVLLAALELRQLHCEAHLRHRAVQVEQAAMLLQAVAAVRVLFMVMVAQAALLPLEQIIRLQVGVVWGL
jgi:hypothetical protein